MSSQDEYDLCARWVDALYRYAAGGGALWRGGIVNLHDATPKERYDLYLAAYSIVLRQAPESFADEASALHHLINLQFPVQSPWSPVFLPPPGPGTYLLAHAWAPHMPASALYRPARGFVWGRWYPPTGKHVAAPLMPGDRWRAL